jgi:hypothetical protein
MVGDSMVLVLFAKHPKTQMIQDLLQPTGDQNGALHRLAHLPGFVVRPDGRSAVGYTMGVGMAHFPAGVAIRLATAAAEKDGGSHICRRGPLSNPCWPGFRLFIISQLQEASLTNLTKSLISLRVVHLLEPTFGLSGAQLFGPFFIDLPLADMRMLMLLFHQTKHVLLHKS